MHILFPPPAYDPNELIDAEEDLPCATCHVFEKGCGFSCLPW